MSMAAERMRRAEEIEHSWMTMRILIELTKLCWHTRSLVLLEGHH